MGILENGRDAPLSIERMIFHLVGLDGDHGPTVLEEITPPEHEEFFLERIRSSFRGNRYRFNDNSVTEGWLEAISKDPGVFAERSVDIAREFDRMHGASASEGVFFLFSLVSDKGDRLFALIKYDIDDVVNYSLKKKKGVVRPELRRLRENFVRKAEAMQKVALVELGEGHGTVTVRDRSQRSGISKYFRDFLNVSRIHSERDLSTRMNDALKAVLRKHREELSPAVRRSGVSHIAEALRQEPEFDSDDPGAFLEKIFGPRPEGSKMLRTFETELSRAGLSEESFKLGKDHIPKPKNRRLETREGVRIIYDIEAAGHTVRERKLPDGQGEEIIITTAAYTVDDAEPEEDRGGHRGQ